MSDLPEVEALLGKARPMNVDLGPTVQILKKMCAQVEHYTSLILVLSRGNSLSDELNTKIANDTEKLFMMQSEIMSDIRNAIKEEYEAK